MKFKLALVDLDNCLVSNNTSEYNQALITFLKDNEFTDVWLFSGRTGTESWLHVLKRGNPHPEWKNQLICNIINELENNGVKVAGVSLPYDHAFNVASGTGYFEYGLNSLEQEMLATKQEPKFLMNMIARIAQYDDDMCLNLALLGDMSKQGQAQHLLAHFINIKKIDLKDDQLEIAFFDDKTDNLKDVNECVQQSANNQNIALTCYNVDFEHGTQVNPIEIEHTIYDVARKVKVRM